MTIEELNAVRTVFSRLERQKQLLEDKLESGGISATEFKEKVRGGECNDIFSQILNIDAEIQKLNEELSDEKVILRRKLEDVDFSYEVEKAMYYFYVECHSVKHIAFELMNYSPRHIKRFLEGGRDMSLDVPSCHLNVKG